MIVKCVDLFNRNTNTYVDKQCTQSLFKGSHYNVLAIYFNDEGIEYHIMADSHGARHFPILVRSQDFKIVSPRVPKNWVIYNRDDRSSMILAPAKWVNDEQWEDDFWQEYDNSTPRTLKCYEEELTTIISADKEFIPIMIAERSNMTIYETWHETLEPIFNAVLDNK